MCLPTLGLGTLHFVVCGQIYCLLVVISNLQCIPLRHKMSGYGGMISDILTVWISDKPSIQQHLSDT
jgi:hypothetical protein